MSKAIHELLSNENVPADHSVSGDQGKFPMDEAVVEGRAQPALNQVEMTEAAV